MRYIQSLYCMAALGTCDMKGGIAGIIKAVLDTDSNKLNTEIRLIFTYDEEIEFEGINDIEPIIMDGKDIKSTSFITEVSFIKSKNKCILGVGPINPHEANEFITFESLNKLVLQYRQIIEKYCL